MSEDAKGNLKVLLVILLSISAGFFFTGSTLDSWIIALLTFLAFGAWFGNDTLERTMYSTVASKTKVQEIENEKLWKSLQSLNERLATLEKERTDN